MDAARRLRRDALAAWRLGLDAVDPGALVRRSLERSALDPEAKFLALATGKAAASMAAALGPIDRGLAIVCDDEPEPALADGWEVLRGGHPVPTREGLGASLRVLEEVEALGAGEVLVYLLSGGSSSLFEVPCAGLKEDEIISSYRSLLGCGAGIQEVNTLRTACSRLKGGGLTRAARPASVVTLALSDVPGDDPAVIGSGPTAETIGQEEPVAELIERLQLGQRLPPAVVAVLEEKRPQRVAAPLPGDRFEVLAGGQDAARAAATGLRHRGYEVGICAKLLSGDVLKAAGRMARHIRALKARPGLHALVAAGETAVTLGERWGEGGRCSHLAAAVALELQDVDGFALVAAGSDGRDGNSRAAGAVVDGGSAARAQAAGRPVGGALKAFDTAAAIREAGDIVETGATGTNVGDLVVATVEAGA